MENKKIEYIEDHEFIRITRFLKKFGIDLSVQTKAPYKNTKKVIVPKDFKLDYIRNLYCINDELGKTEFTVFNKMGNSIFTTQYSYTGYDIDRRKKPRVIIRQTIYEDTNNEFEKYFNSLGISIEEFFLNQHHIKLFNIMGIESTYIVMLPDNSKFFNLRYAMITDTAKGFTQTLLDSFLNKDSSIYKDLTRYPNRSLMSMGNTLLLHKNNGISTLFAAELSDK